MSANKREQQIRQRDKFIEAVRKAVEQQVEPALFSPKKIGEMRQPYRHPQDHYDVTIGITGEEPFGSRFHGVKPHVSVEDPAVTIRKFNALPKNIKVDFEGKSYTIPLQKDLRQPADAKAWKQGMERTYATRETIDKLEKGLKKTFSLAAGKDYSIGYGLRPGKPATVSYMVQYHPRDSIVAEYNASAPRDLKNDVQKYISDALNVLAPNQPSEVRMGGRVVPY